MTPIIIETGPLLTKLEVGDIVTLADEPDCIVPAGTYTVSSIEEEGCFHVGGNTAVWPRRVTKIRKP